MNFASLYVSIQLILDKILMVLFPMQQCILSWTSGGPLIPSMLQSKRLLPSIHKILNWTSVGIVFPSKFQWSLAWLSGDGPFLPSMFQRPRLHLSMHMIISCKNGCSFLTSMFFMKLSFDKWWTFASLHVSMEPCLLTFNFLHVAKAKVVSLHALDPSLGGPLLPSMFK